MNPKEGTNISPAWSVSINGFLAFLQLEKGLNHHSIEAYTRDVHKLARYADALEPAVTPSNIETDHLANFLKTLYELGLERTSQARILSGIKAFFRYLVLEGLIKGNPAALLEGPVLERKMPDVLHVRDIENMLSCIELSTPLGIRDYAIIETLYSCGLRVSELVELKMNFLYLDIGFIRVIGKNNKERLIPIGDMALEAIGHYLKEIRNQVKKIKPGSENHLFLNHRGGKLSRVAIFQMIKTLALKANINKSVSPHSFRHSFATHLIEGGADLKAVQDMLGHASITSTEIYTHMDMRFLKETIDKFHPVAINSRDSKI
jgi:integrase/recombinase XerD